MLSMQVRIRPGKNKFRGVKGNKSNMESPSFNHCRKKEERRKKKEERRQKKEERRKKKEERRKQKEEKYFFASIKCNIYF